MAHRYPYIRSLVITLNSVTRPGSFAKGGMFQLPLPALIINGVDGVVRFPASIAQAKAISGLFAGAVRSWRGDHRATLQLCETL